VDNYSPGNDFATIQNNRPKKILVEIFSGNYSRGNDFATIKNFRPKKFLGQNFLWITILEKVILQR
jgi:hypothetical protein